MKPRAPRLFINSDSVITEYHKDFFKCICSQESRNHWLPLSSILWTTIRTTPNWSSYFSTAATHLPARSILILDTSKAVWQHLYLVLLLPCLKPSRHIISLSWRPDLLKVYRHNALAYHSPCLSSISHNKLPAILQTSPAPSFLCLFGLACLHLTTWLTQPAIFHVCSGGLS